MSSPEFYGIRNTNLSQKQLWSKECFARSFSVALANYMGDRGLPLNLVCTDANGGFRVSLIPTGGAYGTGGTVPADTRYHFDDVYDPYLELAEGVPESSLVVRGGSDRALGTIEIINSVVPDSATRGLPDDMVGPELTIRTPTLKQCALSMASSLMPRAGEALEVLERGIPFDTDWSDMDETVAAIDGVQANLDAVRRGFSDLQRPFLLQSVWKSEGDGPYMASDAMDVFVWTDSALSGLFLDVRRRPPEGITRMDRCAVRLYAAVVSMLRGESPDLDNLFRNTEYGMDGRKEFMVNGRVTNRVMRCGRLTRPAVSSTDVAFLASQGFENMIVPERRLDASVYNAVRAIRG